MADKFVIIFDDEKYVSFDGHDESQGYRFADVKAEALEFTYSKAVNFISDKIGPKWAVDLYKRGLLKIINKDD